MMQLVFTEFQDQLVRGLAHRMNNILSLFHGYLGLLMDDLSVPRDGDVTKPAISWDVLPGAMRGRLRPGGITIANLLPPSGGPWEPALSQMARGSAAARIIHLDDFVNRILVAGEDLPSARSLGMRLRAALRQIGSRQAGRIHVRALR